jgi:hypothetical protein
MVKSSEGSKPSGGSREMKCRVVNFVLSLDISRRTIPIQIARTLYDERNA